MHYFPAGLALHGAVREHEAVGHEPPHPLLGASVEKMLHGKAVGHEPPHPLLGALTKKQAAVLESMKLYLPGTAKPCPESTLMNPTSTPPARASYK